ncbi:MAG: hypothetical protein HKN22_04395 [Bacteroidia bacterium]|nr:hypothetical protein [Bacteroidia bacterium]
MKVVNFAIWTMVILFIFQSENLLSQEIEVESTYEISGKAKRGELQNVFYDENGYVLSYVIRSSKRMIKLEEYYFDSDFRFIKMEEEEIELEKAKTKWKWFKGEAEGTEKRLLRVENNLTGQVVLKQGVFVQKVDYFNGVSWWDFKVLDKTKPKDPSGRRLTLLASKTDEPTTNITYSGWSWLGNDRTKAFSDATGDVTIICSVLPKIKDMRLGVSVPPYAVMRISVDDQTIKSEHYFGDEEFGGKPQQLIHTNNLSNGNMALVFAPTGGPGMKKIMDPDPLNFTYMEVDPESSSIVKTIPFKSLNALWAIDAVVSNGEDIYIYGPSENKKNDKHANLQTAGKYSQFCLAKFSGNTMDWITNTSLDEFASKLKGPPSQKKIPEYSGKKFIIGEFMASSSGDILINGQNTKTSKDGVIFKDVFAFHFDGNGKLKAQYGVDILETNKHAKMIVTESLFRESQDGKRIAWIITEVAGAKGAWGNDPRALNYARIASIDLEQADLSEFQSLGQSKEAKYFLENSFPVLPTTVGGDKLTFFGSNKAGKVIWFSRVIL